MKAKIFFLWITISLLGYTGLQAQKVRIIPNPQEVTMEKGTFSIDSKTVIISLAESKKTALVLQKHLEKILGCKIKIVDTKTLTPGFIQFEKNDNLGSEAYELNISDNGIQIVASNNAGWFYGVQSLLQMFPVFPESDKSIASITVNRVKIKDKPRFSWRAFMLDESRYFKGMKQVKMLLDEMAYLKMNVFHWHLTDDQGWRIEIKKYPLLTEVGSKRKSTQIGPLKWQSPIQSAEPHEGFYTQKQIKEIIKYAQDRHITIVPEIEIPGHSSAAIAAYPWLGTSKKKIEVPIWFGVGKDVYDISDPKVYKFITDVLDEVIELFPSKVIHIGGDEVKYDHWKSSKSVQEYMKKEGLSTPAELQVYFTNKISQYLNPNSLPF